ncbi:hypothetical protein EJB05_05493, partial [Eragrostis curvula]
MAAEELRTSASVAPLWAEKLLQQQASGARFDAVVAQDGTGTFTTITKAIAAAPQKSAKRYTIYVKRGVYDEILRISSDTWNLALVGEGMDVTVITGNRSVDSYKMPETATLGVDGAGFMAHDLTIRNTAGPDKNQSVALRSTSSKSVLFRCALEGYQDTLYAQHDLQFYSHCKISGTVDFIYGDATAVFQRCLLVVRVPRLGQQNVLTAQGRDNGRTTSGFVFQFCNVTGDALLLEKGVQTYLGRPWKNYSRTVFMECSMDSVVHPMGYLPWRGTDGLATLYYAEYNNTGPGSDTTGRVKWPGFHVIGAAEASKFTVASFIFGGTWLPSIGVEFTPGL